MRAILKKDLVTGSGVGFDGPDIPDAVQTLPLDRLRYVEGAFLDAATLSTFWIDSGGRKHAAALDPDWQPIDCGFDDHLVCDGGQWRTETAAETADREERALWAGVRAERNGRLTRSDWTVLIDAPLDAAAQDAWKAYRQALRDVPSTFDTPDDVIWPAEPGV